LHRHHGRLRVAGPKSRHNNQPVLSVSLDISNQIENRSATSELYQTRVESLRYYNPGIMAVTLVPLNTPFLFTITLGSAY